MKPLYELAEAYQSLLTLDDPDLPEEAMSDTLEALAGEIEIKLTNIAYYHQNLLAEAEMVKEAEKRMADRRKRLEQKAASIKTYMLMGMESSGLKNVKAAEFEMKVQKSPASVDIIGDIPDQYMVEKITHTPDKKAIKELLKNGDTVPGARLVQTNRLVIK